jgi:alkylation response protein AidB-like acyl-CoA dehydrogenase
VRPKLTRKLIRSLANNRKVGSDVGGMTTTATKSKDGKHYVLNGQKKWVTQGRWATHALIAARTGGPGPKGVSVFIVDLSTKGITRTKMENSGVSSSGSTFVDLDEVVVPAENVLGTENKGFEIIMSSKYSANPESYTSNISWPSHMSGCGLELQHSASVG